MVLAEEVVVLPGESDAAEGRAPVRSARLRVLDFGEGAVAVLVDGGLERDAAHRVDRVRRPRHESNAPGRDRAQTRMPHDASSSRRRRSPRR